MSTPSHAANRADDGDALDGSLDGADRPDGSGPIEGDSAHSDDGSANSDGRDGVDAPTGRKGWGRRRDKPKKKTSLLKELPVLLIVAFGLAVLIKTFLFQAFFIPSGSMEPTLHGCTGCAGDRVLVNKVVYYFGDPQPGDIVVFEGPDTWAPEVQVAEPTNWVSSVLATLGRAIGVGPPSEKDYVKRVVAVGGQTVQCCDAAGRVLVDGMPVDEPYITMPKPLESRSFGPVTVPEGRLWVMGDNRAGSADSSYHIADKYSGTVAVSDVIGKAALIVWPFSRFTVLDDPNIQALADPNQGGGARPGRLDSTALTAVAGYESGGAPLGVGLAIVAPFARRRRCARLRGRHPPSPS